MLIKIYVSDIEGDNLYLGITKFHCAWVQDVITGEEWGYRPHQLPEYCDKLAEADVVVFHNGIDFDLPSLKKLNGSLTTKGVFDTIVLSRILQPDRLGGHSLKSWGKELNVLKGNFSEKELEDEVESVWDVFTEDMYEYCRQDVEVTTHLYKHLCKLANFDPHNPPSKVLTWEEF